MESLSMSYGLISCPLERERGGHTTWMSSERTWCMSENANVQKGKGDDRGERDIREERRREILGRERRGAGERRGQNEE